MLSTKNLYHTWTIFSIKPEQLKYNVETGWDKILPNLIVSEIQDEWHLRIAISKALMKTEDGLDACVPTCDELFNTGDFRCKDKAHYLIEMKPHLKVYSLAHVLALINELLGLRIMKIFLEKQCVFYMGTVEDNSQWFGVKRVLENNEEKISFWFAENDEELYSYCKTPTHISHYFFSECVHKEPVA